jgi:16S rRNA (uracil1498-N3)-methyltransferase
MARWTKIVTEASKQSLRAWIPAVREPDTAEGLASLATECDVLVLVPGAQEKLTNYTPSGQKPILVVVGPEGGLEPREIELMVRAGATALRLGESVLRTSSAGPAALAIVNQSLGRW